MHMLGSFLSKSQIYSGSYDPLFLQPLGISLLVPDSKQPGELSAGTKEQTAIDGLSRNVLRE